MLMSKKLLERLSEVIDEARDLGEELAALANADELDDDQEARFEELVGEESPIQALIEEREELERKLKVYDASQRAGARESGEGRAPQWMKQTETDIDLRTASPAEVRSAALKKLEEEHREQMVPVSDESAAKIERLIKTRNQNVAGDYIARRLLVTESDAYRSAFAKGVTQVNPAWTPEEIRAINEFRVTEQSLTDASGGFGVPVIIDPTVILTSGAGTAPLLDVARIESITNDVWRGISSEGVTFTGGKSEGAATTAAQATFAQPTVTPEFTSAFIPYSYEIAGDYPNFAGAMAGLIEQGYLDFLAAETETGTAGVEGIFTAIDKTSASEVNPTTDGALGPEDALVVWNALPERFRPRAVWNMNVSVESKLRVGADGYGTRNLSSDGIGPLLGKRVILSDYAPSFSGTTGDANLAILGDFSNFVIAQRVGMNVELVPHVFDVTDNLPTGQRGWFAWARVGSDSVNDNAFILLQNT
jgi:HK97 family phage major capsid protein